MLRKTKPFKKQRIFKVKYLIGILLLVLVIFLLYQNISAFYIAYDYARARFNYVEHCCYAVQYEELRNQYMIFFIPITIAQLILYVLAVFIIILDIGELHSRNNVKFNDHYEDYKIFYQLNGVPTVGKCKICNRAIPLYYGFKVKQRKRGEKLSDLGICFHVDEEHIKFLHNPMLESGLNEFRFLYLNIKRWNRKFFISHGIIISWIFIQSIIVIGSLISFSFISFSLTTMHYLSLYSIGIFWLIIIPAARIKNKPILLVNRLYMDEEDFGCLKTAMRGEKYKRIGPPAETKISFFKAIKLASKNKKKFKKTYIKGAKKEAKEAKKPRRIEVKAEKVEELRKIEAMEEKVEEPEKVEVKEEKIEELTPIPPSEPESEEKVEGLKQCSKCGSIMPIKSRRCPNCGSSLLLNIE